MIEMIHECKHDSSEAKYECIQVKKYSALQLNIEIYYHGDDSEHGWIETIPVNYCPICGYKKEEK